MPSEGFREFVDLEGDEPLAQGDIIRLVRSEDSDVWRATLVVVTADCDLAKRKHAGTLSCVPALEAGDYARLFHLRPTMESLIDRLAEQLAREFAEAQEALADGGLFTPITTKRAREWVLETPVEVIYSGLPSLSPVRVGPLVAAIKMLQPAATESHLECLEAIAAAKAALGDLKDPEAARRKAYSDLASSMSRLPGDAMFLHALGPDLLSGYVVYLRRVIDVGEDAVAVNVREAAEGRPYERVARLASPYVYGLTQQLANVFSSIGLPDDYDNAKRAYVSAMTRPPEVPR